jgi:hypothetical protein
MSAPGCHPPALRERIEVTCLHCRAKLTTNAAAKRFKCVKCSKVCARITCPQCGVRLTAKDEAEHFRCARCSTRSPMPHKTVEVTCLHCRAKQTTNAAAQRFKCVKCSKVCARITCPQCGARLTAKDEAEHFRCARCNTRSPMPHKTETTSIDAPESGQADADEAVRLRGLLPAIQKLASNPLKVIGAFFVVTFVSALLIPDGWEPFKLLRYFTVIVILIVAISAAALWVANRRPSKPRSPRRRKARLRSPGLKPPQTIRVAVNRCMICNRPLTDPRSQIAGVGPDCRAKYGPRPQVAPNPAFAEWQQRHQQALATQQAEQAEYDRQYAIQLVEHEQKVRRWEAELVTPSGIAQREARNAATRTALIGLGMVGSYVLSEVTARIATAFF